MREIKRGNVMAFGPDTNNDLSLKGSLMRQWPGEKVSPPSPAPDAAAEPEIAGDPNAAIFRLGDKAGDLLRLNFARAVNDGTLSHEKIGVQLVGPLADAARTINEKRKEDQRRQDENLRFIRMIKALNDRLADLEQKMADLATKLRAKYGEGFIGSIAAAHLSEKEIEGARSEEDQLKILAEKFLESDGKGGYKIKEEYKDLDEALYVHHWKEKEIAETIAKKIPQGISLKEDDKNYINNIIENQNWNQQRSLVENAKNDQALNMIKEKSMEKISESRTLSQDLNSLNL